jgi:hypothetical protein
MIKKEYPCLETSTNVLKSDATRVHKLAPNNYSYHVKFKEEPRTLLAAWENSESQAQSTDPSPSQP